MRPRQQGRSSARGARGVGCCDTMGTEVRWRRLELSSCYTVAVPGTSWACHAALALLPGPADAWSHATAERSQEQAQRERATVAEGVRRPWSGRVPVGRRPRSRCRARRDTNRKQAAAARLAESAVDCQVGPSCREIPSHGSVEHTDQRRGSILARPRPLHLFVIRRPLHSMGVPDARPPRSLQLDDEDRSFGLIVNDGYPAPMSFDGQLREAEAQSDLRDAWPPLLDDLELLEDAALLRIGYPGPLVLHPDPHSRLSRAGPFPALADEP